MASIIQRITTWGSQILTSSALNAEFNNVVNVMNALDSATTTWDNVKVATLNVTTSATLPYITSWATYTPTLTGVGTAANVGFFWRQVGDTIFVMGNFQCGTVASTAFSITLPNSTTISSSKVATSQTMNLGDMRRMVTGTTATVVVTDLAVIFNDSSVSNLVYGGIQSANGAFTKAQSAQLFSNTDWAAVKFSYPIAG